MRLVKKKLAQSILEYTMIIALVALGIIAMNKYVLRGVWAGIKMWEDQVNDSLVAPVTDFLGDSFEFEGRTCYWFSLPTCPSGWRQCAQWTTTTPTTCNRDFDWCLPATSVPCTTGWHYRWNQYRENCHYYWRQAPNCRLSGFDWCYAEVVEIACSKL